MMEQACARVAIPATRASPHRVIGMECEGLAQPRFPGCVVAVAAVNPIFLSTLRTLPRCLLRWLFRRMFRRSVCLLRRLPRRLLWRLIGRPVGRHMSDLRGSRG